MTTDPKMLIERLREVLIHSVYAELNDEQRAVLAEAATILERLIAPGWQPIETAPKD